MQKEITCTCSGNKILPYAVAENGFKDYRFISIEDCDGKVTNLFKTPLAICVHPEGVCKEEETGMEKRYISLKGYAQESCGLKTRTVTIDEGDVSITETYQDILNISNTYLTINNSGGTSGPNFELILTGYSASTNDTYTVSVPCISEGFSASNLEINQNGVELSEGLDYNVSATGTDVEITWLRDLMDCEIKIEYDC